MTKNNLNEAKNIHFIGIGGIGISAVARMLFLQGKKVSGSDREISEITKELEANGIKVYIGQDAKNIDKDCDLIIYTVAIPEDNPEIIEAKKRGLVMISYPETLKQISKEKYTIAVSGTHGKTTVTAMIAKILIDAGFDPTVLVGSLLKEPRTNFIPGKSKYFVVEADEYKKSFHNLLPSILVINNIDVDHLDFYKDLKDIQDSFRVLALKVPEEGFVVCNLNDKNIKPVLKDLKCKVIDSSLYTKDGLLSIPGEHNRKNSASAYATAKILNIKEKIIEDSLKKFSGTWRRFEYKGTTKNGSLVYDDYAHNPQKIKAALQGAREMFPDRKIIAIFQPHLFSRTKTLFKDFGNSFRDADQTLVLPIYAAREENDLTIKSEMLVEEIIKNKTKAIFVKDFEEAESFVKNNIKKDDVVLMIGAGDINKLSENLVENIR